MSGWIWGKKEKFSFSVGLDISERGIHLVRLTGCPPNYQVETELIYTIQEETLYIESFFNEKLLQKNLYSFAQNLTFPLKNITISLPDKFIEQTVLLLNKKEYFKNPLSSVQKKASTKFSQHWDAVYFDYILLTPQNKLVEVEWLDVKVVAGYKKAIEGLLQQVQLIGGVVRTIEPASHALVRSLKVALGLSSLSHTFVILLFQNNFTCLHFSAMEEIIFQIETPTPFLNKKALLHEVFNCFKSYVESLSAYSLSIVLSGTHSNLSWFVDHFKEIFSTEKYLYFIHKEIKKCNGTSNFFSIALGLALRGYF